MNDERKKLLLRYVSLLAKEFAEGKLFQSEKDTLLSELGVSHEQAVQEAAEFVLEGYRK